MLEGLSLEPTTTEPAGYRAIARLSTAGHERAAASGTSALHRALERHGSSSGERIEWCFTPGADEPWPGHVVRGNRTVPPVWSWIRDDDRHRFLIEIGTDLSWIDGHFPQTPILAGVVQLHWASLLAQGVFGLNSFPRDIVRLKFQHPVLPPALLELILERIDDQKVQFRFLGPGRVHSQGRLLFVTGEA